MTDEHSLVSDPQSLSEAPDVSAPPRDPQEVVEALHNGWLRLPREELYAIRAQREIYIPLLVENLREICQLVRAGEPYNGSLPFLALPMLTEFKARVALPAVLDFVTLPDEDVDVLLGDLITEFLPLAFAVLGSDEPELIESLIFNKTTNEYVRWAAAGAFYFWVRDGIFRREDVVERLRRALRTAIDTRDAELATACFSELYRYGAVEARAELVEAAERDLDEMDHTSPDKVDEGLQRGAARYESDLARLEPTELDDAIEYLADWLNYSPSQPANDDRSPAAISFADDDEGDEYGYDYVPPPPPETIVNQNRKVRRNETCPCGSGRKFKKCCGARH